MASSELRVWAGSVLNELGFAGFEEVVEYVAGLNSESEQRQYWRSLLGDSPQYSSFIDEFCLRLGNISSSSSRSIPSADVQQQQSTQTPNNSQNSRTFNKKKSREQAIQSAESQLNSYKNKGLHLNCLYCGYIHSPDKLPSSPVCTFCNESLFDENLSQVERSAVKQVEESVILSGFEDPGSMNWLDESERQSTIELANARRAMRDAKSNLREKWTVNLRSDGGRVVLDSGAAFGWDVAIDGVADDDDGILRQWFVDRESASSSAQTIAPDSEKVRVITNTKNS
uniref:Uncharacterized protein n=1 Tax=Timspurckia oligopyrenoides TaxID=708627 RepID=A0A7S0ZFD4_9RHOD|mmetsp:Transcript_3084/g.5435  ORF Transcript_3084/g.5435 Transcript_3084/m.5435 type:complete len:284 (+) Transcript_3084:30-881(+)